VETTETGTNRRRLPMTTTAARSMGLRKELRMSFEAALARVPAALASEGFGVLTEIDVKETLRAKLGVDFRRYRILGACNPPLAHEALTTDLEAGLMLPCNVVVFEDDDGKAVVLAVDPTKSAAVSADPRLSDLAARVKQGLGRVLARLDEDRGRNAGRQ
jgi:uncharacterized protein (DUF302 family)